MRVIARGHNRGHVQRCSHSWRPALDRQGRPLRLVPDCRCTGISPRYAARPSAELIRLLCMIDRIAFAACGPMAGPKIRCQTTFSKYENVV
jgi:hypothetical protein